VYYCYGKQGGGSIKQINMSDNTTVNYINAEQFFSWADYLVFVAMLVISAIIGIYYAW
jgi:hypothetical protein